MDFIFKNILTSSANYDTVEEHPLLRYPSFRVIISLSKGTEFRRHGESEINHGDIEINHGDIEISHGDIEINHGDIEINHGDIEINHGDIEINMVILRSTWRY